MTISKPAQMVLSALRKMNDYVDVIFSEQSPLSREVTQAERHRVITDIRAKLGEVGKCQYCGTETPPHETQCEICRLRFSAVL